MKNLIMYLIIGLLITPSAFARKRGKGGEDGGRQRIFKELGLNDNQKAKMKEIRSSRKAKMKQLKENKKNAREAFKSALGSGSSDSNLKSLHKEMLSAHNNFKTYRFETMLQTRSLLDDNQKKKFHELKSKMRHKRHKDED